MDVLLIGYGAIAREVLRRLDPAGPARVTHVLVRPAKLAATRATLGDAITTIAALDDLARKPDLAVECAGHAAVAEHGPAILERGIDLVVVSIGALADRALFDRLKAAARSGKAKLVLPAGAIGGADALAAARTGGLSRVVYTSRKPPQAWKGTPAEKIAALDALTAPLVLFRGRADEAARLYPQNANVAATIALAGIGFDRTEVALIADPAATGNIHRIEAEGAFGSMTVEMQGKPLPENPKSSTLAALSLVRAIESRAGPVEI